MRFCVSAALLLLLALTWTTVNPSPSPGAEECRKLNILKDESKVLGRYHFLAAFTNNSFFETLHGLTSSVWFNVTKTQAGLSLTQFNKMNGTCIHTKANVKISGDTAKVENYHLMSEFELIVFNDTALIMDLRSSTSNVTMVIQKLHLDQFLRHSQSDVSLRAHSYYFIGRQHVPSETDLQQFIAYAKCAGFTGEPSFIQKSDQGYCLEEESVLIH